MIDEESRVVWKDCLEGRSSTAVEFASSSPSDLVVASSILLATSAIQRVLGDSSHLSLLAPLAYRLSQELTVDDVKLDRVASGAARHLVGRAILAVTAASVEVLSGSASLREATAAVLALDRVLQWQNPSAASEEMDYWAQVRDFLGQNLAEDEEFWQFDDDDQDYWQHEQSFWRSLQQSPPTEGSVEPDHPAAKRSTSRRCKKAEAPPSASASDVSSPVAAAYHQLLEDGDIHMDGRLACKRWSAVALVWFLQGPQRLLSAIAMLLDSFGNEEEEISGNIGQSDIIFEQQVVVMAVTGRLASMINDVGNTCGNRPPMGGIETYVRSLFAGGKSGSASRKSKSKDTRTDLRDQTMVVIANVVESHCRCLASLGDPCSVVNAEDQVCLTGRVSLYPYLVPAIESFSKAASASVTGSNFSDQTLCSDRLDTAAAALVVKNLRGGPMDARLTKWALERLCRCLDPSSSANGASTSLDQKVQLLKLDDVLPDPGAGASVSKLSSSSRKKKRSPSASSGDSSAKSSCTFAGMYTLDRMLTPPPVTVADEQLSLFCRAMNTDKRTKDDEAAAPALLSQLIEVAQKCFETRSRNGHEVTATQDGAKKRKGLQRTSGRRKKRKKDEGEDEIGSRTEGTDDAFFL